MCKHTLALVYDRKKDFPVDERMTAVRFTRKRKAGRPGKLKPALTRETPLVVVNGELQQPERPGDQGEAVAGRGGGEGEPTHHAAVPTNLWSSLPMDIGSIQVTDGELQLQPTEQGTSSEEEDDPQQDVEELDLEWNL